MSDETTMIYRVQLERSVAYEAEVQVEADTPAEAESLAEQRASDGMVAWVQVNDEMNKGARACPK